MNIIVHIMTLLSVLTIFSCGTGCRSSKESHPEEMLSFTYSCQGTQAYGNSYSATRSGDITHVVINEGPDEVSFEADTSIFSDLQAIINRYGMNDYKSSYRVRRLKVLDGESWSINVSYTDSAKSFSSSGTNAGPKDRNLAFAEITDFFRNKFLK